jgi:hypothetical protein
MRTTCASIKSGNISSDTVQGSEHNSQSASPIRQLHGKAYHTLIHTASRTLAAHNPTLVSTPRSVAQCFITYASLTDRHPIRSTPWSNRSWRFLARQGRARGHQVRVTEGCTQYLQAGITSKVVMGTYCMYSGTCLLEQTEV